MAKITDQAKASFRRLLNRDGSEATEFRGWSGLFQNARKLGLSLRNPFAKLKGPLSLLLLLVVAPMLYEALEGQWTESWQSKNFPTANFLNQVLKTSGYQPLTDAKQLAQLGRSLPSHVPEALQFWITTDANWVQFVPKNIDDRAAFSPEWHWFSRLSSQPKTKGEKKPPIQWTFLGKGWLGLQALVEFIEAHPPSPRKVISPAPPKLWSDPRAIHY
jgi:hypothetical protein